MGFLDTLEKIVNPVQAIGGVVNGFLNYKAQKKANAQNIALQRETNAQNYKMFQEGNQFTKEQNDLAWARQLQMFGMENEYNSPLQVVSRLRSAGINPNVAFNGSSAGAAMNASGGTPSAGSSVSPNPMVAPSVNAVQSPLAGLTSGFKEMTNSIVDIAQASKLKTEDHQLQELLDSIKQLYAENVKSARFQNFAANFHINMDLKFVDKERQTALNKAEEEIKNYILSGDLISAQEHVQNMLSNKYFTENEICEKVLKNWDEQFKNEQNLLKEQLNTEKSKQNANNASAEQSRSGAALNFQEIGYVAQKTRTEKQETAYRHYLAKTQKIDSIFRTMEKVTDIDLKQQLAKKAMAEIDKIVDDIGNPKTHGRITQQDKLQFIEHLMDLGEKIMQNRTNAVLRVFGR